MFKVKPALFVFPVYVICVLISAIRGFAEESLIITTYYPSPYGSYRELRSQRIATGDNYIDGGQYCWEGACTNTINANADLVVEGNVGIGTPEPESSLHVRGNDGMITIEDNNSAAKFSIAAGSGNYFYIDEGANRRLAIVGGNVGIGTPSPSAKLDLQGTTNICVRVDYSVGTTPTQTLCPDNYLITWGTATTPALASGWIMCCRACLDNNRTGMCDPN